MADNEIVRFSKPKVNDLPMSRLRPMHSMKERKELNEIIAEQ